jgi:hypothetical protein
MQRITETSEMPRDLDTIPYCRLFGAMSIRPPTDVSPKKSSETMRPCLCVPVRSIPLLGCWVRGADVMLE